MIYDGVIGLGCDHPDEGDDPEIDFLEYGFTDTFELYRRAREDGWTIIETPARPWQKQHFCPRHKPESTTPPESMVQIKG